jgi:hypothetical protein
MDSKLVMGRKEIIPCGLLVDSRGGGVVVVESKGFRL